PDRPVTCCSPSRPSSAHSPECARTPRWHTPWRPSCAPSAPTTRRPGSPSTPPSRSPTGSTPPHHRTGDPHDARRPGKRVLRCDLSGDEGEVERPDRRCEVVELDVGLGHHPEVGPVARELGEQQLELVTGEGGAEAEVGAVPEGHVRVR